MSVLQYLHEHAPQILWVAFWHLQLSLLSVGLALVIGIPLGVLCYSNTMGARLILNAVTVVYTIPALALLGLMIPLIGVGILPALIAVLLYSLLPIVQNTFTGLATLDPNLREVAAGLGMRRGQRLCRIELPLALPIVLAGVRVALVNAIGMVTLASLVAAGGLGDLIFRGISNLSWNLILAGSVPVLVLALLADACLTWAGNRLGGRWASVAP